MQIANELTAMLVGVGPWPSIIEEAFPQHAGGGASPLRRAVTALTPQVRAAQAAVEAVALGEFKGAGNHDAPVGSRPVFSCKATASYSLCGGLVALGR